MASGGCQPSDRREESGDLHPLLAKKLETLKSDETYVLLHGQADIHLLHRKAATLCATRGTGSAAKV